MIELENIRARKLDTHNFVVEEYKTLTAVCDGKNAKKGDTREAWVILGYYGTFRAVLKGFVNKVLERDLALDKTTQQLSDKLSEVYKRIDEMEYGQ